MEKNDVWQAQTTTDIYLGASNSLCSKEAKVFSGMNSMFVICGTIVHSVSQDPCLRIHLPYSLKQESKHRSRIISKE